MSDQRSDPFRISNADTFDLDLGPDEIDQLTKELDEMDDPTAGYEITLRVPNEYDHLGSVIAAIDEALRDSPEYDATLPGYVHARRVNNIFSEIRS